MKDDANDFVSQVHDRMPVLLRPAQFDAWLTAQSGLEVLKPTGIEAGEQLAGA